LADELGMGIRLQPNKDLSVEKVKNAINKVLKEPSYRERACELSALSRTYAGHRIASECLVQFLKENEKQQI
jgi:UDP:flavonoid glycosyltransferase YjiC (YdhE family)